MDIAINKDLILSHFGGDRIGEDLSYSAIYDEIMDARINEDENVSRGVWERELKKADWKKVVRLSYDILCNKSKDLQVIGWLCEGIVTIDRIPGFVNALDILHDFLQEYWVDCYPKNEDNGFDYEYKTNILQWISKTLDRKISEARIFANSLLTIDLYDYAVSIDTKIQQYPDYRKSIIESAKQSGYISMQDFKDEFSQKISGNIGAYKEMVANCKNAMNKINNFVDSIRNKDVYFGELFTKIDKLAGFLRFPGVLASRTDDVDSSLEKDIYAQNGIGFISEASQDEQEPRVGSIHNTSENNGFAKPLAKKNTDSDFVIIPYGHEIENDNEKQGMGNKNMTKTDGQYINYGRDEIYDQLSAIANKLQEIDPHSPSCYFVKLVASWKNKTLADIVLDFKNKDNDVAAVLKIFSSL